MSITLLTTGIDRICDLNNKQGRTLLQLAKRMSSKNIVEIKAGDSAQIIKDIGAEERKGRYSLTRYLEVLADRGFIEIIAEEQKGRSRDTIISVNKKILTKTSKNSDIKISEYGVIKLRELFNRQTNLLMCCALDANVLNVVSYNRDDRLRVVRCLGAPEYSGDSSFYRYLYASLKRELMAKVILEHFILDPTVFKIKDEANRKHIEYAFQYNINEARKLNSIAAAKAAEKTIMDKLIYGKWNNTLELKAEAV